MGRRSYQDDDRQPQPSMAFPAPPTAVKRLMIVYSAIFAAMVLLYVGSKETFFDVQRALALNPENWREHAPWFPLWQIASYGFLHDIGNPWHIIGNLMTLYFFGSMLEEELGARRFLLTFFVSQVVGGLCFLGLELGLGQSHLVIGASGGCFGVMIAAATLWPTRGGFLILLRMTLRTMALIFVGVELYLFLMSLHSIDDDPVAHVVHLGGALYGFLAARTGLVRWDPLRALAERRVAKVVEDAAADEQRMDQLLEKIHREGMASLTRGEREFLKRVSSRR